MTPHNEAKLEDIAKIVIMPGDPLRAKYIAENFLEEAKLVNSVRGIYAYTGFYKDKKITIMASGMGMPSMGIYSYELFKIYDVDTIIRIGSCGANTKDLELFDIVLSEKCYTESNYALTLNNDDCHIISSDSSVNSIIKKTAIDNNIKLVAGNTACTDCFDPYMTNASQLYSRIPSDFNPISSEMEAFALFYNAKLLNKKAACIMSVVDSPFIKRHATSEERQFGLNTMIELALNSTLNM